MGLLGWNREIFRLKSRRVAYRISKKIFSNYVYLDSFLFRIIVYVLGVLSLFLLPHPILHDDAKPDERALLIGQVLLI
jgi:hypothetical protein